MDEEVTLTGSEAGLASRITSIDRFSEDRADGKLSLLNVRRAGAWK